MSEGRGANAYPFETQALRELVEAAASGYQAKTGSPFHASLLTQDSPVTLLLGGLLSPYYSIDGDIGSDVFGPSNRQGFSIFRSCTLQLFPWLLLNIHYIALGGTERSQ